MADKMDEESLVALIGQKLNRVINDEDGDVSAVRQENFNYYYGKPYGNERKGYSKIVTRECYEAVEWAMPSILRVFASGDKYVTFDAINAQDEEQAAQETDIVNHFLLNESGGFMVFYEWVKDALMYPNGYVKPWVDKIKETTTEEYSGITQVGLLMLAQMEGVEIVEQDSRIEQTEQGPIEVFDIKLQRTTKKPKLCIETVPPEQALVDSDCTSLDCDEADFTCHEVKRSRTWLIEAGYDEAKLDQIGEYSDDKSQFGSEKVNRLFYTDEDPDQDDVEAEGMQMYWLRDIFMRVDYNGDGIAERRHIVLIGDQIFENEEYDDQPLVALSCTPGPHRHIGMSLIEAVKDIQLIQSTLARQLMDNLYRINIRRKYVSEAALVDGGATLEALQNATTEIIPVRQVGTIEDEQTTSVIGDILPVMQQWQENKKIRTGIAPDLALDPDILAKSTMGAFMGALENASQRLEMIVRIFAETGFKKLMLKVHKLLREHMDVPKTIKLRGKWVEVNPADWKERTNVSVNVGLGFNNREKIVAAIMSILQIQQQAAATGLAQPQNVYNALEKLVEAYGFKNPEQFFTSPDKIPPKGPDPQTMAMMAEIEAQKGQVAAAQQAVENDRQRVMLEAEKSRVQAMKDAVESEAKQLEAQKKLMEATNEIQQNWAKIRIEQEKLEQGWTKLELDSKAQQERVNVPGSAV